MISYREWEADFWPWKAKRGSFSSSPSRTPLKVEAHAQKKKKNIWSRLFFYPSNPPNPSLAYLFIGLACFWFRGMRKQTVKASSIIMLPPDKNNEVCLHACLHQTPHRALPLWELHICAIWAWQQYWGGGYINILLSMHINCHLKSFICMFTRYRCPKMCFILESFQCLWGKQWIRLMLVILPQSIIPTTSFKVLSHTAGPFLSLMIDLFYLVRDFLNYYGAIVPFFVGWDIG